ncbi:phospholipid-transporting ATPase IK [Tenrec ecaudatus]|uniref:phospholipid-transporting ATPase IK n=1 Tax=Tenrec ecaudatus TaxID=94439 RepID=UPI003F59BD28
MLCVPSAQSKDSTNYLDVLEENEDSGLNWEVKANNRYFHWQFKEPAFLCCKRNKYKTNIIRTAKYNIFTFLPLNLYEQFHRISNLYFLFIIILQGIPEISTLPWFTLFAPLLCLLFIRASRDLVDDIGRHRSDTAVNNRPCQILMGKSFIWRKWKDLCVGDVVCLRKDSIVPADMLLLSSTEPSSLCYVETADIDGETNLKFRQAVAATHHELRSIRKMSSFQGKVVCEKPNSRMHHFVGSLDWRGKKYPLDSGNILLRGCKIRNTDTCYGLVIYAGFDTKIMKNCGKIHLKRTKLDHLMNRLVVLIFLCLVLISLALTLGFKSKLQDFREKHHYMSISSQRSNTKESIYNFWGFLILLSVMLPMAMFVISEFIHLGNSMFINWDAEMYYGPLDTPAKARSTSLNDQLGQVEYVLSDKTGTLTQNIMTFKKCCINGQIYGPQETPQMENPYLWNELADGKLLFYNKELLDIVRGDQDAVVREFWRVLALCHTVMVQEHNKQLQYQAASPDEEALVTAARNFGYVFLGRTQDTITVMELGQERVYEVLAMMDFNSDRKRMSVLVRNPEGSICLYTKGADMVIFERLCKKDRTEIATEEALFTFAEQTLRTLCLAYKEVDPDVYAAWQQRHQEASLLLKSRAQALHLLYNEMEQNLQLLGATAIEDRLQDGVPETIKCLKDGNIKVWVLTGDKQETAVNIGFACQLLTEDMVILQENEITRRIDASCDSDNNLHDSKIRLPPQLKMAMVITGDFLDQLTITGMDQKPRNSLRPQGLAEESWQEPGQQPDVWWTGRLPRLWRSVAGRLGACWNSKKARPLESPQVLRERAFLDLALSCQAVICCRVTPKQKALIVKLIKRHKGGVTLAIGDGANDVNMIKTADIGVGLAGQEGMQAVQNSDYVLAQFAYLQRLLLVHGRWSYMRVCKFLRYFIYKTLASMMSQIWFAFYNGITAQPLYEGWFLALFNLLYSTLPVLYIGLFEQDVSAEKSLQMPALYVAGQKEQLFNYWVFFQAVAHGTITSLINFFVTLLACWDRGEPNLCDYQSFGVIVALSSLLSVTVEVIMNIKYWTVLSVLAIVLSFCCYAFMTYASQSEWFFRLSPSTFPFLYADRNVLLKPFALLVILLNVAFNTLCVLAFRTIYKMIKKSLVKVEEVPPSEEAMGEPISYLYREARVRRSSYAFSHREGYADLITQGTILRRARDTNDELAGEEDQPPLECEVPPLFGDSTWRPRRMSLLGKKKLSHIEVITSEMLVSISRRTSSVPKQASALKELAGRPTAARSADHVRVSSPEQRPPPPQDRSPSPGRRPTPPLGGWSSPPGQRPLSSPEQSIPSPEESLPSTSLRPPQPSDGPAAPPPDQLPTVGSQPTLQGKLWPWTPRRLTWPFSWPRKPFRWEEPAAPQAPQTPNNTPPQTTDDSFVTEQSMEVEFWPLERQPSSMEWLPAQEHLEPEPSPPERREGQA